ncbi:SDR family oxidoreductase [Halococcus thailandensis]|nr:SDR family oxidoreductase [Halococcus thailandensis]
MRRRQRIPLIYTRATSLLYAEEGADIIIADIQQEPRGGGDPTHERIESETDASATFVECNVTDYEDMKNAVAAADEFGGVDVMVNNAGVFRAEEFLAEDDEIFDMMMNVNVRGTYYGSRAAANAMVDENGGSIVNLSSAAGLDGSAEFISYCASKGAVRLMTYSLGSLLGPENIRVNAIHPGLIETSMTTEDVPIFGTDEEEGFIGQIPTGRGGTAEDVAKAALFLASDLADYVNAESLVLDGGMTNTQ